MPQILVGTSGYGYHEWIGPVYPGGTKPDAFLGYYAGIFPTVELNYTYYRMPTFDQLARIRGQAGPSMVFSVKANDALTHRIDASAWRTSASQFRSALEAMGDSLGAVLLQFPYSFHYEPDRRRYLNSLLEEMGSLPLAVEFRNHEWYNNRVIDALRERRVALASLDLPTLKSLPPIVDVVTSSFAYVRFHGRNGDAWWGSDSASRYDYLYSDQEIGAFAERIASMASRADRVLAYFNNHRRGQAVQNGRALIAVLKKIGQIL